MNGDESKQGQAVFSTTAEGERQNNSVECHGDGVELLGHDKTSGEQPFAAVSVIQQLIPPLDTGLKPGRTIGAIGLAFIAFVSVCGGPFGIEDAVGAAGPLVTLISLLVLGVFWALPQALMTAGSYNHYSFIDSSLVEFEQKRVFPSSLRTCWMQNSPRSTMKTEDILFGFTKL